MGRMAPQPSHPRLGTRHVALYGCRALKEQIYSTRIRNEAKENERLRRKVPDLSALLREAAVPNFGVRHWKYGIFLTPDSNLLPMPAPQTCPQCSFVKKGLKWLGRRGNR
jgi:hypothetical protein